MESEDLQLVRVSALRKYSLPVFIATVVVGLFLINKIFPVPNSPFPFQEISSHFTLEGRGFILNGVFPAAGENYPAKPAAFYGSWLGSDRNMGSVVSNWLPITEEFSILVTGYPSNQGNLLAIEVMDSGGRITRLQIHFENAFESWRLESSLYNKCIPVHQVPPDSGGPHAGVPRMAWLF